VDALDHLRGPERGPGARAGGGRAAHPHVREEDRGLRQHVRHGNSRQRALVAAEGAHRRLHNLADAERGKRPPVVWLYLSYPRYDNDDHDAHLRI
jgi:hypothetical protein